MFLINYIKFITYIKNIPPGPRNSSTIILYKGKISIRIRLGELRRVLNFMKLKEDKPRIMIDDDFIQIKIWLDAYKAEHDNIWGHTRGSMSFAC